MDEKPGDIEDFSELVNYVSMYDWITASTNVALDPSEQEDLYNIDMINRFYPSSENPYANPPPIQIPNFNLTPEELDVCMKLNLNDLLVTDQPESEGLLQPQGFENLDVAMEPYDDSLNLKNQNQTILDAPVEETAERLPFLKLVAAAFKSRWSNSDVNGHSTYVAQPEVEQAKLHISPEKELENGYIENQLQSYKNVDIDIIDLIANPELPEFLAEPTCTQSANNDDSSDVKERTHQRNFSGASWLSFSSVTSGYHSTIGSCSNLSTSADILDDEDDIEGSPDVNVEVGDLIKAPVDEIITTQKNLLPRVVANVATNTKKRLKAKLQGKIFGRKKAKAPNIEADSDINLLNAQLSEVSSPDSVPNWSPSSDADPMDTLPDLPKIPNERPASRKSGRDHRDVEKKYRDRIKRSTAELKELLTFKGYQKQSINDVLLGATEEIKRLRKIIDHQERELQLLKQKEQISEVNSIRSDEPAINNEEEEWKQVQQASTVARQSARDGAKIATFTVLFLFSFVNPIALMSGESSAFEGDHSFHSRELMNDGEEILAPTHSPFSQLLRVGVSLLIFMFILLRGNIRCKKNTKITQCFKSQLRKAQKLITQHDYEDAKNILRLSLLIIGDRCPRTPYGQIVSYVWKNICHLLYQASLMKILETIGRFALPSGLLYPQEKNERQNAAKMLMTAYQKLHEIALKDVSCTSLEADCYLMNTIHAAEVSGDHELLCVAYATAAVHMKEKAWFLSSFLQHYFADCADHQACLARQDSKIVVLEWIFDVKGYDYFTSGLWDLKKRPIFHTKDDNLKLDEADLLQTIFYQYQEHLLTESLKRIVIPDPSLKNDRDIEIGQSYLASLKSSSAIQKVDWDYMRIQSLYSWWVFVLKLLQHIEKQEAIDEFEQSFEQQIHVLEQINSHCKHEFVTAMKSVLSAYISVLNVRKSNSLHAYSALESQIQHASSLMKNLTILTTSTSVANTTDLELQKLISIACYTVLIEAKYMFWLINHQTKITENELVLLLHEQESLQTFCSTFQHISTKVKRYDSIIQEMSGMNHVEIHRLTKRREFMISTVRQHQPRIVCVKC